MNSNLNVKFTDVLGKYVTPSKHILDLIRQDLQDRAVALNILGGLEDLRHGKFSDRSILDLKDED